MYQDTVYGRFLWLLQQDSAIWWPWMVLPIMLVVVAQLVPRIRQKISRGAMG